MWPVSGMTSSNRDLGLVREGGTLQAFTHCGRLLWVRAADFAEVPGLFVPAPGVRPLQQGVPGRGGHLPAGASHRYPLMLVQ